MTTNDGVRGTVDSGSSGPAAERSTDACASLDGTTPPGALDRRRLLGSAALAALAAPAAARRPLPARAQEQPAAAGPAMVGSANALRGMKAQFESLGQGRDPLDAAIEVVKVVEADPNDHSVGIGGLPDEDGHVTLDAAVMHGPTHNSGAVGCIENILHPSEVARLVMERTDHCLLVGPGAYEFARLHGHPHTELLTEAARRIWVRWKETMSDRDDRLAPRSPADKGERGGAAERLSTDEVAEARLVWDERITGTIHCSALSSTGDIACTTTTSGLAWKIPGRVGDSPIIGAGLYCDQEVGSAGGTGRGESAVLANASFAVVERMRAGDAPVDALREVLRRVQRQAQRASAWQPGLVNEDGKPAFDLQLYAVDLAGRTAGMSLLGRGKYAVADASGGPRLEPLLGVDS